MGKNIFVIEDEPDMLDLLTFILSEEGFNIYPFKNGEDALLDINLKQADLVLLDLMLPKMNGYEVCKKLKNMPNTANIPIIMLSSRSDDFDILLGLDTGCDDYITKPFNEKILLAKIKAILRRNKDLTTHQSKTALIVNNIVIDPEKFELSISGQNINLTTSEFKTLYFLIKNKGKVFSREQILEFLHEGYCDSIDRSIDILITRIRKKMGDYSKYIQSVYGIGYRFNEKLQ